MAKKRTIITPVIDGRISQQSFLVESSFWKQVFDSIKSVIINFLALIGAIEVISWFF